MAVESVKNVQMASFQSSQTAAQASEASGVQAVKETTDVEKVTVSTESGALSSEAKGKDAAEKEPSDSTIKQAIKDINRKMNSTVAEFGYHEGTHRVTIKIKDKDTDKVVKEIPAEKTLDMIAKAWELAGLMVDEKR